MLFESTHRHRDGTEFPVEVSATYFEYGGSPYNLALARDVSERRKAESLLVSKLELEAQFRQLAENIPDIICRYDANCRLVYANSGLAAVIGRSVDEVRGLTPVEFDPELETLQAALAATFETGEERTIELTLHRYQPRVRYHHVRIIPERGRDDQISGVLALGLDFTERKEAEARLHASEQAFRAVVEHSPDFIARYDRECQCVYVNPALRAVLQQPTEEHQCAVDAMDQTLLASGPGCLGRVRQVVKSGLARADEVRFRNAEGVVRWGHLRTIPEFAPDGQVASVLSICRDIDELKRSEQLFRTLTENHPDFIVRFDRNCRHTYVNPRVSKAWGIPQGDFVGKRLHELDLHGNVVSSELLEAGIRCAFESGEPNRLETRWTTGGEWQALEVRHIPEKDVDGNVVSVNRCNTGISSDNADARRCDC
jgi:PAS domain S-box-containing protein